MTNPTTTPDPLPVEASDRAAAADWFELTNSLGIDHTGRAFEEALRDGTYDGDAHPLVQAFARHRIQSQPTPSAVGQGGEVERRDGLDDGDDDDLEGWLNDRD